MEDILKQILSEIKGIKEDVSGLKEGQESLKKGQESLRQELSEFKEEVNSRFDEIEQKQIRTHNAINKLRKEAKALWSENERLLERTSELRQK